MKTLQRLKDSPDLIPTSSMADIAFLLIIFFMITLTFSASRGLDLFLPEDAETRRIETVESVHVKVLPDSSLVVDGQPLPFSELLSYLDPKLRRNPKKPVILETDPQAPYGAMVDVYDELRQGQKRLGLQEEIQIALPTRREALELWYSH